MSIKFKSIDVIGLRSIDNLCFNFDSPGVNMITGYNGVGKTSIFEALYFALFGKTLKGDKLEELVMKEEYRKPSFKGLRVMLCFESGGDKYTIARHINYKGKTFDVTGNSNLFLIKNDDFSTGLHKSNVQEDINEILGVNSKTFLNSVLFGQRLKKLIETDNADKVEIFSKFFDVEFIDEANEKAKSKRDELLAKSLSIDSIINMNQFKINEYEIEAEEQEERKNKEKKDRITKVKELREEIKSFVFKDNVTVDIIKSDEEIYNRYKKELNSADAVDRINDEIRYKNKLSNQTKDKLLKKLKEEIDSEIESKCFNCGVPYSKESLNVAIKQKKLKIKSIEKEIADIEIKELQVFDDSKLKKAKLVYEKYESKLKKNKSDYDNYVKIKSHNDKIENEIKKREEMIAYIKSFKTNSNFIDYSKKIKSLQADIKTNQLKLKNVVKEKETYEWWVKEGFAMKGLKSYIINTMLNHLNHHVSKYALKFGLRVIFRIELSGKMKKFVTECYKIDGTLLNYNSFSGGEKTRIDLILMMGIYDLLSQFKSKFNIMILDEAFENLDEEGIYDMYELLRERAKSVNVFIVTHTSKDIMGINEIRLVKQNNFTEYEEAY